MRSASSAVQKSAKPPVDAGKVSGSAPNLPGGADVTPHCRFTKESAMELRNHHFSKCTVKLRIDVSILAAKVVFILYLYVFSPFFSSGANLET